MDNNEIKDLFSNMYSDFFGIEKLTKKNFEDIKEIYEDNEIPKIDLSGFTKEEMKEAFDTNNKNDVKQEKSKEQKDDAMKKFFESIDALPISNESKNTLKKMVEYARKYDEKITKTYIPFNMRIYSDNNEIIYKITDILRDSLTYFEYLKKDDSVEASFYLIEDAETLSNIYSKEHTLIVLKNVSVLNTKDAKLREKILNVLETSIMDNKEKCLTILVDKSKEVINETFSNNAILRDKIFDFEIETKKLTANEIHSAIIEKIKTNEEYTEKFEIKLLEYIIATFPKTTLSYPEYIEATYEKILFNKSSEKLDEFDVPEYEKEKSNEEIFAELNELVGLDNVKEMLKDLVSLIEFKNKTKDKIKIKDTNLHMVFLGNPGTGKTTVARMVAGILYNLKYIDQNKLVEVSAKDLVAEYVGQTGPKTMAVIEKAMGGVLFVDEAYSLASKPGENNSFNEEAIATLIQAMENYRDNLVVIFAGYSKEMQDFLNSNSGIVSRIGYTLEFKDYTVDELIIIFESMLIKAGFEIDEKAIEKAKEIIVEYKDTENFGNARFVRNLYEKAVIKHASNTKDKKALKSLKTIVEEDIVTDNLLKM
ncbi:MAG: AAA family ATPase [Clostridia bacterium]|nr:AAA family ATPase [Clostridia bacterium]